MSFYSRLFAGSFDDLGEVGRLQGSAADEAAVDVFLSNKAFRVAGVHGAAVLDDELVGRFFAVEVSNEGADEVVDFVGLLVGRGLAGADGPDRHKR